jgi:hypothetical protein
MTNELNKSNRRIIVWSVIWALALIVAGVVYKGNPAKDQVISVVTVVGTFVLLALLPRQSNKCIR